MVSHFICLTKIKLVLQKIEVRQANSNEKMTTLDNAERDLLDSDIVITNGNEPIALGGVMGGELLRSY